MAVDTAPGCSGSSNDRIRRLDHLEAGIRSKSKRIFGADRVRMHVPGGQDGDRYDLVRAWVTLAFISPTGGAALAIITSRGRW